MKPRPSSRASPAPISIMSLLCVVNPMKLALSTITPHTIIRLWLPLSLPQPVICKLLCPSHFPYFNLNSNYTDFWACPPITRSRQADLVLAHVFPFFNPEFQLQEPIVIASGKKMRVYCQCQKDMERTRGPLDGWSPMSSVDFKKWQCPQSLFFK